MGGAVKADLGAIITGDFFNEPRFNFLTLFLITGGEHYTLQNKICHELQTKAEFTSIT